MALVTMPGASRNGTHLPAPTRRQRQVALLIETSNNYGRGLLYGVINYIREHARWSCHLLERGRGEKPPPWLADWRGDGIIARIESASIAQAVAAANLPAVDVSAGRHLPSLPWVETDDRAIARLAAEHLLGCGFQHIAYCGDDRFPWSRSRRAAFAEHVQAASLRLHDYAPDRAPEELSAQVASIADWLVDLPKPLAVFACYDIRGQQVLAACQQLGLAVPDEVAVLGVDNDELLCELAWPPLSSIIPDARRAGYEAAALLDRMMAGERLSSLEIRIAPLGICRRRSTDGLAIEDRPIAQAMRFIRDHACEPINVADVVKQVPLSRRVFEARFKKLLGHTPHDAIMRARLERVKQLLAETDLTLEAIAERTGFLHAEYLSVTFKREVGVSPRAYRTQRREGT